MNNYLNYFMFFSSGFIIGIVIMHHFKQNQMNSEDEIDELFELCKERK